MYVRASIRRTVGALHYQQILNFGVGGGGLKPPKHLDPPLGNFMPVENYLQGGYDDDEGAFEKCGGYHYRCEDVLYILFLARFELGV